MYLTICFKLRADDHDRARLRAAMTRWSAGMNEALDQARAEQGALLRCIQLWESKDGKRTKLVVNDLLLDRWVKECVRRTRLDLHSSAKASMVVALKELLGSWLGQYILWDKEKRKKPKPSFPVLPPAGMREAKYRWETLLETGRDRVMALPKEDQWRADITREARDKRLPLQFGAATSGMPTKTRGQIQYAHCGLVKRPDGRYFALLTLWPQGDRYGEKLERAANRRDRGPAVNVKPSRPGQAPLEIDPERATSSMMIPLEYGSGPGRHTKRWERVAFGRGQPQSAELVFKRGEFYLHTAFEFPDHPPLPLTGAVLAVRRGIGTLIAVTLVDKDGVIQHEGVVDGKALARTITEILKFRALQQVKGQTTKGDRKASMITRHLLYSAGHQLIDRAYKSAAELVLLRDPDARRPVPFLAYKHFHRLFEILIQLTAEAGLKAPLEREIYASYSTCVQCGWAPGDVRNVEQETPKDQCPRCQAVRSPEFHLTRLLALDTLRFRAHPQKGDEEGQERRPRLGAFIQALRAAAGGKG